MFVIITLHLSLIHHLKKSDTKSRRRAKCFDYLAVLTLSLDLSQGDKCSRCGEEANNIYIYINRVARVFFSLPLFKKFRSATSIHSYALHAFTAKDRRLTRYEPGLRPRYNAMTEMSEYIYMSVLRIL